MRDAAMGINRSTDLRETPVMTTTAFRKEKDTLGELEVPAEAWYGIQTTLAVANFPI
jgi:hypothetical protein